MRMFQLLVILLAICGGLFAQTKIELSTQVKGTLPAAQAPALTGAVTSSVGSTVMSPGKIDVLNSSAFCQAAGASGTTYTCNLSPAITAYVTGTHYRFKADVANTAASTINFNGQGAKTIKKAAGGITTDIVANDIQAGQWVDLVYDGTNMQMQSTLGNAAAGGGSGTVASATAPQIAIYKAATTVTGDARATVQPQQAKSVSNSTSVAQPYAWIKLRGTNVVPLWPPDANTCQLYFDLNTGLTKGITSTGTDCVTTTQATTQAVGDNSTKIATTAYVTMAVANALNSGTLGGGFPESVKNVVGPLGNASANRLLLPCNALRKSNCRVRNLAP